MARRSKKKTTAESATDRVQVDPADGVDTEDAVASKPRDRTRKVQKARRFSRITPRRWLPFMVLIAVVAGGVALARHETPVEGPTRPVATPGAVMPVAAPSDALSTAFFCPGGTSVGEKGEAEVSVVVANARAVPTTADVTLVGSNGERTEISVEVAAHSRSRVTSHEHLNSPWASITVEVLGGDIAVEQEVSGPLGSDASPCPTGASSEWFIPSGSTVIGAEENILIYNPFSAPAIVSAEFVSESGESQPRALQGFTVEPRSVKVLGNSDDLPARRSSISSRISTRVGQVVVGRVQRYDGSGEQIPAVRTAEALPAPVGLAAVAAMPKTSQRWVLPMATNHPGVVNSVAIYNPGERTAEISLWLQYEERQRNAEIEPISVTVRAGDQAMVDLRSRPGLEDGIAYSIVVDSFGVNSAAQPVVAELQVFNTERPVAQGAADSQSVPDAQSATTEPSGDESTTTEPSGDGAPPEANEGTAQGGNEVVNGYAVVPGSPVTAAQWIVTDVLNTDAVRSDVMVVNPGSLNATVTVEAIGSGDITTITNDLRLAKGDQKLLDLSKAPQYSTLIITSHGAPVVVGQMSVDLNQANGVRASVASPVPGEVRTIPAIFQP